MTVTSKRVVLVADPVLESREALEKTLREAGYGVQMAPSADDALRAFYAEPPYCMIVRYAMTSEEGENLLLELKSDNVYGHLPAIITVSPEELAEGIDWVSVPADDFVVLPVSKGNLAARIQLCWSRALREVNAHPLTGLPGNLIISREAEQRMAKGEDFALAYLDLDEFKSFNDRYGFSRGDEMLRMTSRVLVNAARAVNGRNTCVGHVGGDDFIFITSSAMCTKTCERIIASFDSIVPDFYDAEDRKKGGIQAMDRKGTPQWYSMVSCTIGVVDTSQSKIKHVADLFGRVAEVQHFAKRKEGSNYVVDRRE